MPQTSREIVTRCLKFENPERMPRIMSCQPWAEIRYPEVVKRINALYPPDYISPSCVYQPSTRTSGEPYVVGTFVDEWGCVFENLQAGIIGEVKSPQIVDIIDWRACKPPYEILPADYASARDIVNRFCAETDKFTLAGCCPRPWERMQFLHGTAASMMDVMTPDEGLNDLLRVIHEFYMKELEFWATTDVDCFYFMDDWGSQRQLLIPPRVWRELFKPLYKDYCDLARANGKFTLMHSDGCIAEIYEDLIEIGVNAVNSQLFTMDMADLASRAKGKITFHGEIDRQHILPSENPQIVRDAVQEVAKHFYDPAGGIVIQFEFGPSANPNNPEIIFNEWEKIEENIKCRK